MFIPYERLRRIWTPKREIEELFDNLAPATELDSQIREYFTRIVMKYGTITLDITEPADERFQVRWEIVHDALGRRQISIWSEPKGE